MPSSKFEEMSFLVGKKVCQMRGKMRVNVISIGKNILVIIIEIIDEYVENE